MTENLQFGSLNMRGRDVDVLRGLFESRIMTTDHIAAIFFEGKREYAKKRLQKLKAADFIRERKRLVNEKSILVLTGKAFTMLRSNRLLSDFPALSLASFESRVNVSEFTIEHELAVMDVKAAFYREIGRKNGYSVAEFRTWPRLFEFKVSNFGALVKPDGFIRLIDANGAIRAYFLEIDRSTEAQKRLIAQALRYRQYYYGGGFAIRNGAKPENFKKYPFQVLMAFKSPDRRNNTAERLLRLNPPILRQIWLSTLAEITSDPIGPIWVQPVAYSEPPTGTPSEINRPDTGCKSRTQSLRGATTQINLHKMRLFG